MQDEERAALEALMADEPALMAMADQEMQARRASGQKVAEPDMAPLHCSQAVDVPPLPKQVKPLEIYRASDLYGKQLKRPPIIIDGMVPAGLSVLAGAPKRGKSWMALKMALCVASGDNFFGFKTKKGDVLYMDLESKDYRVQDRLSKLLPGPAPDSLYFCHKSDRLDGDLLEQLKMWIAQVENPSMIIIDTLGRVKGGTRRGENAYESDTRIFGELQAFALESKIAIICVHHLKKDTGNNNDYFERISGSMGITGACDAVMVLAGKRGEETSVLKSSSRDFEAQDFVVRFNGGDWGLVSCDSEEYQEQQEYSKSQVVRGVIAVAHHFGRWQGTISDLMVEVSDQLNEPMITARSNEFGKELQRWSERLNKRENIKVISKRASKGRRQVVIESTARQQEMIMEGENRA